MKSHFCDSLYNLFTQKEHSGSVGFGLDMMEDLQGVCTDVLMVFDRPLVVTIGNATISDMMDLVS